ncbi:recombinase family protein [Streptomyces sp. NPDC006733]|uniref:recombinase family protein n=1 Tax=Streptomyces sp. NPDC006733 TaxID=3155460 RepID=UPI00340485DB
MHSNTKTTKAPGSGRRVTCHMGGAADIATVPHQRRHPHPRLAAPELPALETQTMPVPAPLLRGRPPYGYRVVTDTVDGRQRRQLVPDDRTAPVVQRIFHEYLAEKGLQSIAEGLTADGISSPGAARHGLEYGAAAWSKSAVRAILVNNRYVDAAPGSEAVVPPEVFDRVQRMFDLRRTGPAANTRSVERVYSLRGLVRCGQCNRLMQGTWNNDEPYYRCRFPAEYASANEIDHPRNVYLREQSVLGPLLSWLRASCAPDRLARMAAAAGSRALHEATIGATARRIRMLHTTEGTEQTAVLQAMGLKLTYAAHNRMLQVKVVLNPAELVVRGSLAL